MNTPQFLGEHELPFCTTLTALRITPVDKLASICCLLIRTGLTKYFDWQYPRSRFPEYNHFLFLKCVNQGKTNSKLFLWSWDFEVNNYECAISAVKTHSSQTPWQHNFKKAIFKVPTPSPSTGLISSPYRFTVSFPGQDRRQEVPQGSFTRDFHQVVVPPNTLQNLSINSTR